MGGNCSPIHIYRHVPTDVILTSASLFSQGRIIVSFSFDLFFLNEVEVAVLISLEKYMYLLSLF